MYNFWTRLTIVLCLLLLILPVMVSAREAVTAWLVTVCLAASLFLFLQSGWSMTFTSRMKNFLILVLKLLFAAIFTCPVIAILKLLAQFLLNR